MTRRGFLLVILLLLALFFIFGDPIQWGLNIAKRVDQTNPQRTGARLVEKYECLNCHRITNAGAYFGPELTCILHRDSETNVRNWLRNPRSMNPNTHMPRFWLSESEITALLAYLQFECPQ